jgi:hypothetical protein
MSRRLAPVSVSVSKMWEEELVNQIQLSPFLFAKKKQAFNWRSIQFSYLVIQISCFPHKRNSPDFIDIENAAAFPTRRAEMVVANFMVLDLKGIPVVLLWNWRSILRVRSCAHHHVSYPIVPSWCHADRASVEKRYLWICLDDVK